MLDLEAFKGIDLEESVLGWILKYGILNERGDPIEFDDHNFLIEPFADWHWKQCCMKSAQVGWSTLAIIKTFYAAAYRGYNIIYTLPTFDDIRDFVPSKVDQIAWNNPIIRDKLLRGADGQKESDAMTKKQIGNNFIWYRGTHGKKAAIMHTADLIAYDELDASKPDVVDMYSSRLQKSKYKGEWWFSNPIMPSERGIAKKYELSDMRHWMVKCEHCNHFQALDFFQNIDMKKEIYICSKCGQEMSDAVRHDGEWVAEFPGRDMHGYHINQLMAMWVTAKELIFAQKTKSPQYFYNMILGIPYVEKDDVVDKRIITRCIEQKENSQLRNAMGVDVGHKYKHYVLGNHEGIFKVGEAESWDEVEELIKRYNPVTVIDANPDFYARDILRPKYPNQVYCCFYKKDREKKDIYTFGAQDRRGYVYADRNAIIQSVVEDFNFQKIKFTCLMRSPESYADNELEEYLKHWGNIYRVVETDTFGIPHSRWDTSGPDHFVHATVYWKIAISRVQKMEYTELNPPKGFLLSHDFLAGRIPADKVPQFEAKASPDDWLYT